MPNQTSYNNNAVSSIVYFRGLSTDLEGDCCFKVVDTSADLASITDPNELDVAFIQQGTNGGVDIAIFQNGEWIIKPLKGADGADGDDGQDGQDGATGATGATGSTGAQGAQGLPPEHQWDGTKLQFKNPDGSWGTLVDLQGVTGATGADGADGAQGLPPNHKWDGTQIRFELPDGSWGVYVDLQGAQGIQGEQGEKGDIPNHEWNGTEIRFELPDGTWSSWTDLKGEMGEAGEDGLPPEHEIDGCKIRFRQPDGEWGEWLEPCEKPFDGTDPKCLADQETWDAMSGNDKLQTIIDKICQDTSGVLQRYIDTMNLDIEWGKGEGVTTAGWERTTNDGVKVKMLRVTISDYDTIKDLEPKLIVERYRFAQRKGDNYNTTAIEYRSAGWKFDTEWGNEAEYGGTSKYRPNVIDIPSGQFMLDLVPENYFCPYTANPYGSNLFPVPRGTGGKHFRDNEAYGLGFVYLRFKLQIKVGDDPDLAEILTSRSLLTFKVKAGLYMKKDTHPDDGGDFISYSLDS